MRNVKIQKSRIIYDTIRYNRIICDSLFYNKTMELLNHPNLNPENTVIIYNTYDETFVPSSKYFSR